MSNLEYLRLHVGNDDGVICTALKKPAAPRKCHHGPLSTERLIRYSKVDEIIELRRADTQAASQNSDDDLDLDDVVSHVPIVAGLQKRPGDETRNSDHGAAAEKRNLPEMEASIKRRDSIIGGVTINLVDDGDAPEKLDGLRGPAVEGDEERSVALAVDGGVYSHGVEQNAPSMAAGEEIAALQYRTDAETFFPVVYPRRICETHSL